MDMAMFNKNSILLPKSTHFIAKSPPLHVLSKATPINFLSANQNQCVRYLNHTNIWYPLGKLRIRFFKPISAVGSGLKDSVSDPKGKAISVKNATILVESEDDDKIQVRVELKGVNTQKIFDKALTELSRSAPPVPGFRKQKGGKPSKVPTSVLLLIAGKDRVTKFVIQEIVTSTLADYVKKENLTVKENKIETLQSSEQLKLSFKPGSDFGFNAILDLVTSEEDGNKEDASVESPPVSG